MEGRLPVKGNEREGTDLRTQSREAGLEKALERIREAVRRREDEKFTSLYHHVYNIEHLREAYEGLKKKAAAGIDGKTWQDYGQNLESNLEKLSEKLARQAYRALPVQRKYIAKADGRQRPLGIPAIEDKIVQYVTGKILSTIWEEEFMGFSYGFRPGRSAHQALDALVVGIERKRVNWVLDADIRGFFDTISHEWLVKFIEHRIGDKRILGLIQKWLKAGVIENGEWQTNLEGTPQGGLISPILANIYLHYAFDLWARKWRKRKAKGDMILVRYADDFVVGFEDLGEAKRFRKELAERLNIFNLDLHEQKTRLIEFGRFAIQNRYKRGHGKPETFDFLGFTHYCGTTQKGYFTVKRKTMRKRMHRKLKEIKSQLKYRMHDPIPDQGQWLRKVLQGYYRYYGVPFNSPSLWKFHFQVRKLWRRQLNRRSQKAKITEKRMGRFVNSWLPNPCICHPFPSQRLIVKT